MNEGKARHGSGLASALAFAIVTSLFFSWGFISANTDPLIAALRAIFTLSYTEAILTQIVFFLAYGAVSLPAAGVMRRVGPVTTILIALLIMVAGCLVVQAVTRFHNYGIILGALFILGSGITVLQVAANPLAASLGSAEHSHFRLTFAQAFNSLGVVLGAHYGARLMLEGASFTSSNFIVDVGGKTLALAAVSKAFLIIAICLGGLAVLMFAMRARITQAATGGMEEQGAIIDALRSRWAIGGAVAIAAYVGAEVAISALMINFLAQPHILALPLAIAGEYLANFYWGGALIGRFIGSYLLTRIAAAKLLAACAVVALGLCMTVVFSSGETAAYAALAVGLFNSIMFPTIFTIALQKSGVSHSATSGLLCLAIAGGALLPLLAGRVADSCGLNNAFLIPMLGYAIVLSFAGAAAKHR